MEIQNEFAQNQLSQPTIKMPVFNSPDVFAEGWYFVPRAADLNKGKVHSFSIGYYTQYVNNIPMSPRGKRQ